MQECVRALNYILRSQPAMYENQFNRKGFEWVTLDHREQGIIAFKRKGKSRANDLLIVLNVTVLPKEQYGIKLKGKTRWLEIFSSDDVKYWGSGKYMNPVVITPDVDKKKKNSEIKLNIPPLAAIILKQVE